MSIREHQFREYLLEHDLAAPFSAPGFPAVCPNDMPIQHAVQSNVVLAVPNNASPILTPYNGIQPPIAIFGTSIQPTVVVTTNTAGDLGATGVSGATDDSGATGDVSATGGGPNDGEILPSSTKIDKRFGKMKRIALPKPRKTQKRKWTLSVKIAHLKRIESGEITQYQLANELGVAASNIRRWGKSVDKNRHLLGTIATSKQTTFGKGRPRMYQDTALAVVEEIKGLRNQRIPVTIKSATALALAENPMMFDGAHRKVTR
jgi:transposase-like protein